MTKHGHCLATLLLFSASPAHAQFPSQYPPPPVDMGIQNIPQETPVWCWAAVAQQIVMRLNGPAGTPPQCGMVAIASNLPPAYCCQMPSPCLRTGQLYEIQALIAHFGGRFSSIAPPTDPMTLYQTLASHRPIIMAVQSSPYSSHVVLIRGMSWIPEPTLFINDPMGYLPQAVPYRALMPYWMAAIVVY